MDSVSKITKGLTFCLQTILTECYKRARFFKSRGLLRVQHNGTTQDELGNQSGEA